jgi:hypothetical protein
MTTQITTLFLATIAADSLPAVVIDEVDDNEMYIGYCQPDCTSFDDAKWLIKRVFTDENGKRIFLSNGSRRMNCKWSERRDIVYAPTEQWAKPEKPAIIEETDKH